MTRRALLSISLLLFVSVVARSQTDSARPAGPAGNDSVEAKVDRLFAQWSKPDSPGAALIVVKDGQVALKKGYGSANLEYDIPITPSTIFHVASVSKQFTAFAVALLASQGKLSLDEDIRKYVPEVPDFGKKITARHLIHHTSGLRDQWELLAMAGWRLDDVITKEHILKMVRHEKELNFEPGHEYLYCNTGYTLLAVIVERVTGQSFRQFTHENIFKPLGMTHTHFHDDHQMIVKNRAYSYAPSAGGGFQLSALNYANVGATSLFTTVEDLARWTQNFEAMKVGGASVIEQVHQQGVLNSGRKIDYAFGLSIGKYKGLNTVAHSGGDAGFRSYVVRFPDQRFAVAILSNLATFNPVRLANQVADLYLADKLVPEPTAAKPAERAPANVNPSVYDAYVGKYLLEPATLVTISRENASLFGQPAGQPRLELVPESETRFYLKGAPGEATIEFHRDGAEKAARFILTQGGQPVSAKRIEQGNMSPDQLAEYAGDYYSEELGTTYSLTVQNGRLVATHRRHEDTGLNILDKDLFTGDKWWFRQVRFIRDKDAHIAGFRLTGGRVRNMHFSRQSK